MKMMRCGLKLVGQEKNGYKDMIDELKISLSSEKNRVMYMLHDSNLIVMCFEYSETCLVHVSIATDVFSSGVPGSRGSVSGR